MALLLAMVVVLSLVVVLVMVLLVAVVAALALMVLVGVVGAVAVVVALHMHSDCGGGSGLDTCMQWHTPPVTCLRQLGHKFDCMHT